MEAACLGIFMISAAVFTIILEHPASSARQAIADPFLRRMLIGIAMGLTAIGIIYPPGGKAIRSTHQSIGYIDVLSAWKS